jgi:hypothetical protein
VAGKIIRSKRLGYPVVSPVDLSGGLRSAGGALPGKDLLRECLFSG